MFLNSGIGEDIFFWVLVLKRLVGLHRTFQLQDQPHFQGAVAAWAQEGLEELSHVEGQDGWW